MRRLKPHIMGILCFFLLGDLFAYPPTENNYYTYVTDRVFYSAQDLVGYTFRPAFLQNEKEEISKLKVEEISFFVTTEILGIARNNKKQTYTVNNIESKEYGFIIALVNPYDLDQVGHLKIILDKERQAEYLIYKESVHTPEYIFHLARLDEAEETEIKKYYTSRQQTYIKVRNNLWGYTFTPYLKIENSSIRQDRIDQADNLRFGFSEEIIDLTGDKTRNKVYVSFANIFKKKENKLTREIPYEERRIRREYYFNINGILDKKADESDSEQKYKIKMIEEKVNTNGLNLEERYQLEIHLENSPHEQIFVYLTNLYEMSCIELDGVKYYLR